VLVVPGVHAGHAVDGLDVSVYINDKNSQQK
jgi:hypothetical protein